MINALGEAIDVYADWVDAAERVGKDNMPNNAGASRERRREEEEEEDLDDMIDHDEEDDDDEDEY